VWSICCNIEEKDMDIPSDWTEGDIDLGDGAVHYYRAGVRGGPAVVLAHGFSDQGTCWIPTVNALSAQYDLVMPDSRGHGRSSRVEKGGTYDLVDDLIRVMAELSVQRPIVFGHSMGALQAGQLAARRPDGVRALVLIDPPWMDLREDSSFAMHLNGADERWEWVKAIPGKTLEQYMAETRSQHPQWPVVIVERWCEGKKLLDQNVMDTTLMPASNLRSVVAGIHCPALLFTADPEQGGIVTPELATAIEQMNPHFKAVRIRNTGHHLNFTHHDEYMEAVQAFLAALPS
jgi:pimeloyl-ACP methyl ester carboxylesterase